MAAASGKRSGKRGGRQQAGDDRVTRLPGIGELKETQFAGYASIYPKRAKPPAADAGLFYWFAGAERYEKQPTILWSNGGPGSSSLWGFFIENGPYRFEPRGGKGKPEAFRLAPNPNGWNRHANYLIFEHPLSVTLSFCDDDALLPANVELGIEQLYQALLNFLERHPEIADNPIVLAGESYAGTYLPLLAKAILDGNQHKGGRHLDLRSVILCDGWVDPVVQMATDTTYAYRHGMITAKQKKALDRKYEHNLPQVNEAIQRLCGLYMANIAETGDPPFQPVLDYINRADVRRALHVDSGTPVAASWSEAIGNLYAFGVNDSYAGTVEELLRRELQVMVISGLNDAKDCNFIGTGAWLERLKGRAAKAFRRAETTQWQEAPGGRVLGYTQDGGLLSWTKVLNAGHLASMDQPLLIDLITRMSRAWPAD